MPKRAKVQICAHEGLLERLLGRLGVAQEVAQEATHGWRVPLVKHGKRSLVPVASALEESCLVLVVRGLSFIRMDQDKPGGRHTSR